MTEQRITKPGRTYRMARRLEHLEATRQRIAEAAFELHSTIGPAQTTISAVADRAGVQRHTVYRHFPNMTSLIQACTEHGMRVTRIPAAASWRAIKEPATRLEHALGELYAYYRPNARLLGNMIRDMPFMAQAGGSEAFVEHMTELFAALAEGWPGEAGVQRMRMAVIGHAMSFETWQSLTGRGLSDSEVVDLMLRFVTTVDPRG
ncbi:MAG: TetR/AcrR family transcriptional regulator [Chloroflexota bacterium]|nr:TetR/AcrR family transcriptional regulator [Chloroflexota bacterium]